MKKVIVAFMCPQNFLETSAKRLQLNLENIASKKDTSTSTKLDLNGISARILQPDRQPAGRISSSTCTKKMQQQQFILSIFVAIWSDTKKKYPCIISSNRNIFIFKFRKLSIRLNWSQYTFRFSVALAEAEFGFLTKLNDSTTMKGKCYDKMHEKNIILLK